MNKRDLSYKLYEAGVIAFDDYQCVDCGGNNVLVDSFYACAVEIEASAGRDGFVAGFKLGTETPKPTVENCHPAGMVDFVSYQVEKIAKIKANQYADSIRQEKQ